MNEPVHDHNQLHLGMRNLSAPIHFLLYIHRSPRGGRKKFPFVAPAFSKALFSE